MITEMETMAGKIAPVIFVFSFCYFPAKSGILYMYPNAQK